MASGTSCDPRRTRQRGSAAGTTASGRRPGERESWSSRQLVPKAAAATAHKWMSVRGWSSRSTDT